MLDFDFFCFLFDANALAFLSLQTLMFRVDYGQEELRRCGEE